MIYLEFFLVVLFMFLVFKIFTKNHHKIVKLEIPKKTLLRNNISTLDKAITYQQSGLKDFIHREINAYLSMNYSKDVKYEIVNVTITKIEYVCLGSVFISFRVID